MDIGANPKIWGRLLTQWVMSLLPSFMPTIKHFILLRMGIRVMVGTICFLVERTKTGNGPNRKIWDIRLIRSKTKAASSLQQMVKQLTMRVIVLIAMADWI